MQPTSSDTRVNMGASFVLLFVLPMIRIQTTTLHFLVVLSVTLAVRSQAQNFENASLEVWADPTICEVNTPPDNWVGYSTEGVEVDEANLSICPSTIPPTAAEGTAYCRAYAQDEFLGEGIAQNVSGFTPGNEYQLSFEYAGSNVLPGSNDVLWTVFIDDVDVDQTPSFGSDQQVWTEHIFTFFATNEIHQFGFRAFTADNSGSGSAGIDNFNLLDITPIEVNPPVGSFLQSEESICVDDCIVFTSTSQFATSLSWTFEGGNPEFSEALNDVTVCYNQPGDYSVQLVAFNDDGTDTVLSENAVTVHQYPEGSIIQSGDSLIVNSDVSEVDIQWQFNGEVINPTDDVLSPFETGVYEVTLISETGCNTLLQISVDAAEISTNPVRQDVWIPNAITLDGDNINDTWMVYGNSESWVDFKAAIYTRWGEKIFESNNPRQPWIGEAFNGQHFVPDGMYIYDVSIRFSGESETNNYRGHIIAIR